MCACRLSCSAASWGPPSRCSPGRSRPSRLLARAISLATGQPVPHIKPAVSEAFVVATPRVKSAQKVRPLHVSQGDRSCTENFVTQGDRSCRDVSPSPSA